MHIEPGVVDGAKMILAVGTAATSAGLGMKLVGEDLKTRNPASFVARTALATVGTFICFEVLPHFVAGVSEVHLIMGTTLMLILGAGPAALGLAMGLLFQGLFFSPTDLPMFFVNVTTLVFPLFLIATMAKRVLPSNKPYVDLTYTDVLKLSAVYQGGIIAWVAFWVIFGQGFGAASQVMTFAVAYALVIAVEPLVDLAALAGAKALVRYKDSGFFAARLHNAA